MTPSPTVSFSVANINPGSVRTEFFLSVMALVQKERALGELIDPAEPRVRFDQFYSQFTGPYLDDGRNLAALWFLNHVESDYLVFIDSDIEFDPNQVYDLVRTAAESSVTILTGVYYNSFWDLGGMRALVHRWAPDPKFNGEQNLIAMSAQDILSLTPSDKPHEIDACGAGFVAIHRSCLEDCRAHYDMPQPIFAELNINGIHMGEDLSFCIRARALNHPTYVLPSITVAHYKTCAIRPTPQESPHG